MAGPVIKGENYRISVINGILGALGILRGWCFLKMVRRKLYKIEILDLLPVRVVETEAVLDLHTEHLHLPF